MCIRDRYRVGIDGFVANAVEQELINTRVLGNLDVDSVTLKVSKISSCHTKGGTGCQEGSQTVATITSGFSCSMNHSAMEDIAQVTTGCKLSFDGSETMGGDIVVRVTDDANVDYVPFRIWFPSDVKVDSMDTVLNKIEGGCDEWAFQRSQLSAVGDLVLGDAKAKTVVYGVDVTRDVSFCLRDDADAGSVVWLNGTTVYGVGVGAAEVVLCTDNDGVANSSALELSVTQQAVQATDLNYTVVLNSIVVDDTDFDDSAEFTSQLQFGIGAYGDLQLTVEGDAAWVFPFATFSDGTAAFLDSGSNVTSLSQDVVQLTSSNAPFEVTVPVGASSGNSSEIVAVMWSSCSTSGTPVWLTGAPWVTVALPDAISVAVSTDNDLIYYALDPLVTLDVATEAILSVVLSYEDGSERDMETDSRTVFTPVSTLLNMTGNVAEATEAGNASVTIDVSFGAYSALTDSIVVTVAEMNVLVLQSSAHPSCSASGCSDKQDIYPIQYDDGVYQRVKLAATAVDSLGNTFSVGFDDDADVTFNDTDVLAGVATGACNSGSGGSCTVSDGKLSNGVVTGVGAGFANVAVEWFSFEGALDFEVHGTATIVTNVAIASPTKDFVQTEAEAETVTLITTTFADGTKFVGVKSDGSNNPSSFVGMDDYLNFSTSDPSTLSVDATGTLTLWNNTLGDDQVTFTVHSSIDASVSASTDLFGNLKPSCYDVDIGMTGSQVLPSYGIGDTFELPIMIHTCNKALTGFQIQIFFDPSVVLALKDEEEDGKNWPGTITYTYGSPSSMVQVLSSEPSSSAKSSSLLLTTIMFEVVGDGATWFSGLIVDTLTTGGDSIGDTNRLMVSGLSYFETSARARSRQLGASPPLPVAPLNPALREQTQRRLAASSGLRGDTNGDELFTVSDLDTIKRYYVGGDITYVDEAAQLAEMDADLDGEIDTLDIVYINSALAKKFRFLMNETADVISVKHTGCTVEVNATLLSDTGAAVVDGDTTKVFYVLGDVGEDMLQAGDFGSVANISTDGVVYEAATPDDDGVFRASFRLDEALDNISIVVFIETYEDNGDTDEQRRIAFYGTAFAGEDFSFTPLMTYEHSDMKSDCLAFIEANVDADSDSILDYDQDSDSDGISDGEEGFGDSDSDSVPDAYDGDTDNDGIDDYIEGDGDADSDSVPNDEDTDSDNDGIDDSVEGGGDADSDSIPNNEDTDSDNDGIDDSEEGAGDADSDSLPNNEDTDSDNDGICLLYTSPSPRDRG